MKVREIAHARSGDKGDSANIGLIAFDESGYRILCEQVTADRVQEFFQALGSRHAVRYELPNLLALNFVLDGVLAEGGSRSLRLDAQGKVLGQALLEMEINP
jgi:hypothetical protein